MSNRLWFARAIMVTVLWGWGCTQGSGGRTTPLGGTSGGTGTGTGGQGPLGGSATAGDSTNPVGGAGGGGTIAPDAGPGSAAGSTGGASSLAGGNGGRLDAGQKPDGLSTGGSARGGASTFGGVATTSSAAGGRPQGGTGANAGGTTGGVTGSGASTEGCDIGVYDAASPPKVLTLTGNLGVHDPAAIAGDGTTYLYQTGLGAKTSKDMTTWAAAAKPLNTPAWMSTAITGVGDLWAPDISFFSGKYHLYYSGSTFGSNKSCIGHATRESLVTGSWTDTGAATLCSNIGSTDNWNAIDPNVVLDDAGTPWLAFGSFWSGLKIVQLDSAGQRVGTTVTAIAARPSNGGALEAPFIVRRCGTYYLFMSWDKCCVGADSTYNIRVVRATSITGPYSDKAGTAALQGGGTLIAQGNTTWAGPGGQSVMIVGQKAYLVYHAYAKSNGTATLRIADLVWDDSGWPMPVGP
jgi:arabinan endo-1,5-alpha-L-arabinosidase